MKREDEVISFEIAKELKELGINTESAYSYMPSIMFENGKQENAITLTYSDVSCAEKWAAYTVGELLEMIPAYIDINQDHPFNFFHFNMIKRTAKNIQYICQYICDASEGPDFMTRRLKNTYDENAANCIAKMLIKFIRHELIPYEKGNENEETI